MNKNIYIFKSGYFRKLSLSLTTLLIFTAVNLQAQNLWSGPAKEIVRFDFGTSQPNQNYGPPLSAGTTNYTYWYPSVIPMPITGPDLQDNKYAILPRLNWNISHPGTKNTSGQWTGPGAWHIYNFDHSFWLTGQPNGNMLVVNAAFEPGIFFQQRVDGLCSGSTYEFSAYLTNLMNGSACNGIGIPPNVKFQIENLSGTILAYYSTGNITQKKCTYSLPSTSPKECVAENQLWQQKGMLFTVPQGVSSIVIRLINTNSGGCGNDLAIDDISLKLCEPTINIASSTPQPCEGQSYSLNAQVTGFSSPAFQWQKSSDNGNTWIDINAQTSSTLQFSAIASIDNGLYRVLVATSSSSITNENCRTASTAVNVNVNSLPTPGISLLGDSIICNGSTTLLSSNQVSGFTYQWYKNDTIIQNANDSTLLVNSTGIYSLSISNTSGCSKRSVPVHITVNSKPYVSVITPVNTSSCEGDYTTLSVSDTSLTTFQWYKNDIAVNGANASAFLVNESGLYSVSASNDFGCSAQSLPIAITVRTKPIVSFDLPKKDYLKTDSAFTLNSGSVINNVSGTGVYTVDSTVTNQLNPQVLALGNHSITYTFISTDSCSTSVTVLITIAEPTILNDIKEYNIPNTFSPNGDGINDYWVVNELQDNPDVSVKIFDRNGKMIYNVKGKGIKWDGTDKGRQLPAGVYFYRIHVVKEGKPVTGWIHLMQ